MIRTTLTAPLAAVLAMPSVHAEEFTSFRVMVPALALDLAQAALNDCRQRGFQVAVEVVDRFGVPQVMLRDALAGAHTPETAIAKARTAVSFRAATEALSAATQAGQLNSAMARSLAASGFPAHLAVRRQHRGRG